MAPPKSKSVAQTKRERWIAERSKKSVFWGMIHLLGSLKLAMLLLGVVAVAVAVATFLESGVDSQAARRAIYQAPWFMGWLAVLCLNLFCSALTRWPWQRKHTGFVVTHAGIIILLAGAMVGRMQGFEAMLTLRKGDAPQNRITVLNQDVLQLQSPDDGASYLYPWAPVRPGDLAADKPRWVSIPRGAWRLKIEGYSESLQLVERLVVSADPAAPAAVEVALSSARMGQDVQLHLFAEPADARAANLGGMADVEFAKQLPAKEAARDKRVPFREMHVVLAAYPHQPIIDNPSGELSGYRVAINKAQDKAQNTAWNLQVVSPQGRAFEWPLASLKRGQKRSLSSDPAQVQVLVREIWPDFVLKEGKPATLSSQWKNPGVLVELEGARILEPKRKLTVSQTPDGKIAFEASRPQGELMRGAAGLREPFALGWADWKAVVTASYPHAEAVREFQSVDAKSRPPAAKAMLVRGIQARLVNGQGQEGPLRWIPWGTREELPCGSESARIGFGPRQISLNFSTALEDFQVPRDPGTETPADFISSLCFRALDSANVVRAQARMNQPAAFPGGFWRSALGKNYKFSQASYDPKDLSQTTLQILFDPGWPAKWIGSLMVCVGIALMFYFKKEDDTEAEMLG